MSNGKILNLPLRPDEPGKKNCPHENVVPWKAVTMTSREEAGVKYEIVTEIFWCRDHKGPVTLEEL